MYISRVRIILSFFIVSHVNTSELSISQMVNITLSVMNWYQCTCVYIIKPTDQPEYSSDIIFKMQKTLFDNENIFLSTASLNTLSCMTQQLKCRTLHVIIYPTRKSLSKLTSTVKLSIRNIWLAFTKSDSTVEKQLEDIYIPFDCHFLVVHQGEITKGANLEVPIFETYNVHPTRTIQILKLATWSSQFGLTGSSDFPRRYEVDLQGITLKAAAVGCV